MRRRKHNLLRSIGVLLTDVAWLLLFAAIAWVVFG